MSDREVKYDKENLRGLSNETDNGEIILEKEI